jgi:hypothetical protein
MVQQCVQMNLTSNISAIDPTEWLKHVVNNPAVNLMYPFDCNNIQYAIYPLDTLTPDEIMNAWSIFYNNTIFNNFWNKTQQEYYNHVPAMWYTDFSNDYGYDNTSESNATRRHYKHIADLMIYMGAQTLTDNYSRPLENTTSYGLDAFNQNYNQDLDYPLK